ncbi:MULTISPECIES: iron-sulfur cluster insertion protein ErpA [Ignatzschineria]
MEQKCIDFKEKGMSMIEDTGINFTDSAALKVKSLIEEEGDSTLKLRVYIQGGGCSGFQYGFAFANEVEEGDVEVVNQDVVLLIDPLSYQYLVGAEIDYVNDLQGEQFVIRNPNATTTCGCGNSFSA